MEAIIRIILSIAVVVAIAAVFKLSSIEVLILAIVVSFITTSIHRKMRNIPQA